MEVGDMVKLVTAYEWPTAIIVSMDKSGWFWVLQSDGIHRMWPPGQMELIDESR
jgi:hypothetical protein